MPCKGMYADVSKQTTDTKIVDDMYKFKGLIQQYEEYKRGYRKEICYPKILEG